MKMWQTMSEESNAEMGKENRLETFFVSWFKNLNMKKNPFRENREREEIVRNIFLLMKQRMLISMLVSKTYTRSMILKHKLEIRDKEEKKEKRIMSST